MEAALQESFRMYMCARCQRLVLICRKCDRGNIYCSKLCSQEMRKESLRRSSRKYQASLKGQLQHAARQEQYRCKRRIEKVTQQGPQVEQVHGSLVETTEPGATRQPLHENSNTSAGARCCFCGTFCGGFVRLEPWHGGRYFPKRRKGTRHDRIKRNRGRGTPASLC